MEFTTNRLSPWPEDALDEFADEMLKKTTLSTNSQLLKESIKFCTRIHRSAIEHVDRYPQIALKKLIFNI